MIADKAAWLSTKGVASMLGICHHTVPKVMAAAKVRTKNLPGMYPRFHRADVEKIAAESLRGDASTAPIVKKERTTGDRLPAAPVARRNRQTA